METQIKEEKVPFLPENQSTAKALFPGGRECPEMPEGTVGGGGVSVVRGGNRQELAPPPP